MTCKPGEIGRHHQLWLYKAPRHHLQWSSHVSLNLNHSTQHQSYWCCAHQSQCHSRYWWQHDVGYDMSYRHQLSRHDSKNNGVPSVHIHQTELLYGVTFLTQFQYYFLARSHLDCHYPPTLNQGRFWHFVNKICGRRTSLIFLLLSSFYRLSGSVWMKVCALIADRRQSIISADGAFTVLNRNITVVVGCIGLCYRFVSCAAPIDMQSAVTMKVVNLVSGLACDRKRSSFIRLLSNPSVMRL